MKADTLMFSIAIDIVQFGIGFVTFSFNKVRSEINLVMVIHLIN